MMITCPACRCPWYGEDGLPADATITCSCGNDLTHERITDEKTTQPAPAPDTSRVLRMDVLDDDTVVTGSALADRIDRLIANARATAEIGRNAANNPHWNDWRDWLAEQNQRSAEERDRQSEIHNARYGY